MYFFFFWLLLLGEFGYIMCQNEHITLKDDDERLQMAYMMMNLSADVIKNQNENIFSVRVARQDHSATAAFEIGYLVQMIQEHYRRMLDKWRSTRIDIRKLYGMEVTLYLEEIEHLYWSIKHEVYMMHEIEKKYKIRSSSNMNGSYEEAGAFKPSFGEPEPEAFTQDPISSKMFNVNKFMKKMKKKREKKTGPAAALDKPVAAHTTRQPKKKYFPINYGWEPYEWNSNT